MADEPTDRYPRPIGHAGATPAAKMSLESEAELMARLDRIEEKIVAILEMLPEQRARA